MAKIHPTAVVEAGAQLDADVEVGAYCVVGPHVRIAGNTRLMPHAVVDGWTTVGKSCILFPFASVGSQTQDLKFKGGAPRVEIGDRTTLRECVTVNAATNDGDVTRIGSDCYIMAYAHVAHDCTIGNGVILANSVAPAGHVTIEDQAIIGGLCGIHQFVRIGRLSIIGGCSKVTQDVPPFMMADGHPLEVHGINSVGLKRKGIAESVQSLLKRAYRILYREDLATRRALERIEAEIEQVPEIQHLVAFVRASERGITR